MSLSERYPHWSCGPVCAVGIALGGFIVGLGIAIIPLYLRTTEEYERAVSGDNGDIVCTRTCTNIEIPSGFVYADGEIPDSFLVDPEYGGIVKGDATGTGQEDYECAESGESATRIPFSYQAAESGEGGWSYRYAVVCGTKYLVVDGHDSFGERTYGPFEIGSVPDVQESDIGEFEGESPVSLQEWTLYEDEENGFSMQYPSDWKITDRPGDKGRSYLSIVSPERLLRMQGAPEGSVIGSDVLVRVFESVQEFAGIVSIDSLVDYLDAAVGETVLSYDVASVVGADEAYSVVYLENAITPSHAYLLVRVGDRVIQADFDVSGLGEYPTEKERMEGTFTLR